jgi:tetratricopeptide (TPR) repeat protein
MAMLTAKCILAVGMALPLSAQTTTNQLATHAQAAQEAEQRSDFSTAAREYEYLTRMLSRSAEMQSNLGVALYFDHQWERAIAVFGKAIALNPDLLAPHLFTGLAWYQLSKPDAAVPELKRAVRIGPSDVIAHTWLGYAFVAQSRYEAAAAEFEGPASWTRITWMAGIRLASPIYKLETIQPGSCSRGRLMGEGHGNWPASSFSCKETRRRHLRTSYKRANAVRTSQSCKQL